jgi:hypothetical protein
MEGRERWAIDGWVYLYYDFVILMRNYDFDSSDLGRKSENNEPEAVLSHGVLLARAVSQFWHCSGLCHRPRRATQLGPSPYSHPLPLLLPYSFPSASDAVVFLSFF